MELFLNTASPIMIITYLGITALFIFIARKLERAWPLISLIVLIIGLLVYHTITLEGMESSSLLISNMYHCIAVDLVLMLLIFISYLWVDDIIAKNKKLKSYDDSLSWFWNKI